MKNSILSYIRELSIVIVGISVAFGINKWSDSRKSLEKEKLVLETVLSEIQNNNFYVKGAIGANEVLLKKYDSVLVLLDTKSPDEINTVLTISKLLFQDSGMDLAISIGVLSDVEFQLARDISFCYKLQQNILDFEKSYFDYLEVPEENRQTYYSTCRTKVNNFTMALKTLDEEQIQLQKAVEEYIGEKF